MEDFEYSLEISDRDWECFFTECEECNLLPPSLAHVDDSGMSDFDDLFLTQRARGVDPTLSSPVNDHPVDSPPKFSGSPPVERCFGQKESSGFDSVLSGSEEDIHLQSVNIFFERIKGLRETEQDQERVGINIEAKQEGQQVSGRTLPKSCPMFNTLPDRVEKAFGKEIQSHVNSVTHINTMKIVTAQSKFPSEPETCSTSPLSSCRSPETELYITEGDLTDNVVDEVAPYSPLHGSTESFAGSDTRAQPYILEMWRRMDDIEQEDPLISPETFCKKCSSREDQMSSPEGSQLVSLRRKRRRRRRLSLEAGEGGHPCVRQSNEEHLMVKEGRRLFLSTETLDLKEEKKVKYVLTPNPATIKLPENFPAQEIKIELSLSVSPSENQCQPLQQKTCTDSSYLTNHESKPSLSQTDDKDNDAAELEPNGEFQVAKPPGVTENLCLPVSTAEMETETESQRQASKSAILQPSDERNVSLSDTEPPSLTGNPCLQVPAAEMKTQKTKNQRQESKSDIFQTSDESNLSLDGCKNEQHAKHLTAEVKSVSLILSAESCAPAMEVVQKGKLSAAKSDQATDAGNSGPDKLTACQNDSEGQEQLDSDGPNTNQRGTTVEETNFSVGGITYRPRALEDETLDEVNSTFSTSEHLKNLPCEICSSGNVSGLNTDQQTDSSDVLISNIFLEKHKKVETSPILNSPSNILTESEGSQNESPQTSPSDISHVSSCCTLDSELVLSLSTENKFPGFCSSVSEHIYDQEGMEHPNLLADHEVNQTSPGSESQEESKAEFASKAEEVVIACKDVDEPQRTPNSVFAMSSFWKEIEKLTINDILGLRNEEKSNLHTPLPVVKESEETVIDSGIFTEEDEPKPEEPTEEMSEFVSSSSRTVTWQSDPVLIGKSPDIGPECTVLESGAYSSQPVLNEKAQKGLKKFSKTVSVQNLKALESDSFSYMCKGDTLQILEEQESENLAYFTGSGASKKDSTLPSSSTNTYRISFTNIFQYFFGEKQSVSSQSAREDTTCLYTSGNSVPETYDHFFSEFDNESFFPPLLMAAEKNKVKPVPIFSYSRSTSRHFQFPEAYEHFFASSSSDDSSGESDEEESFRPLKVVSRFTRKVNSTQVTTDVYEDFFTDCDITENLFSLSLLSFRKVSFTPPAAQEEGSNLPVPLRQSSRHQLQKIGFQVNALDVMFPDPLLYQIEERISRQLALQTCRYEGLEVAVSDPRLDAPLLPLKQSDMCLVCIAFASWVLKTANPGAGDAWKAVLLANVSALSAIRYLRRYVKVEAATTELKSPYPALTLS